MMPSITIHDLPDDIYAVLTARAASSGVSVEEYVRRYLIALAPQATEKSKADVLRSIRERKARTKTHVSVEAILEALDAGRR